MRPLRTLSTRAEVLVDQLGVMVADPTDFSVIGRAPPLPIERLIYALQTNTQSGLTRRYYPSLAPGESSVFGCDFSDVIALGVGIMSGTLTIQSNIVPPAPSDLLTAGPVSIRGRALYATITAQPEADGADFQLVWQANDSQGGIWPRTGLVLCSATS